MSNSDSSEIVERNTKQAEILDDDVSIISASNPYGQLKSILLRVILALIFLGMGVGAVVYSVSNSEKSSNTHDKNITIPEWFNIHMNQLCLQGKFKLETNENMTSDGELDQMQTTERMASWIQYDSHQRLYLRIGLKPEDWLFTDYVHPSFTVRSSRDKCVKNLGISYESYLENMGLNHLRRSSRQEAILINGKYTPMVRYEGTADTSFAMNTSQPAVLFAYSNPENGVSYGWEMLFPRWNNSTVFHAEWWFGNMTEGTAKDSIFFDYPSECELHPVNDTFMPFLISDKLYNES